MLLDRKDARHCLGHQPGIGQRREFDQPDAVLKGGQDVVAGLDRQARLAAPSRADEREQAGRAQEVPQFGDLFLAPDEACQLQRQVVPGLASGACRHPCNGLQREPVAAP